jgi:hydroxyacyl-ACP dehydratase HTD2-like protein with hotdog domain
VRFKGSKFFPDTLPETLRFRMSFDAGKDIALGVSIRPGDVITIVSTLHEVYEKTGRTGSMIFVVVRFTMTNQRGEQVAVVDNRFMYKGPQA